MSSRIFRFRVALGPISRFSDRRAAQGDPMITCWSDGRPVASQRQGPIAQTPSILWTSPITLFESGNDAANSSNDILMLSP